MLTALCLEVNRHTTMALLVSVQGTLGNALADSQARNILTNEG